MRLKAPTRLVRILAGLVLTFVVYSVGLYFGVPAVVRYVARNQAAGALHRHITLGDVKFNPYKLHLLITNLRVAARDTPQAFIAVGRMNLRLSWTSLFHLALVVKQFKLDGPSIHVVRVAPRMFDVSDLLLPSGNTQRKGAKSIGFAVSNIEVNDGRIVFDDQVLKQQHRIEHIRLAIPFIANLPTDADSYVQPMLQMTVDGSAFNLSGKTKPFQRNFESLVEVKFEQLDLVRFVDYVPTGLRVKLTQAQLSAAVQVHFIQASDRPRIQAAGTITLENVAIRDQANSPHAKLKRLQIAMAEAVPLESKLHFSSISIDSLTPHVVLYQGNKTNFTSLLSGPNHVSQSPPSGASAPPSKPNRAAAPLSSVQAAAPIQPTPSPPAHPAPVPPPGLMANPMLAAPSPHVGAPAAPSNSRTGGRPFSLAVDLLQLNNSSLDVIDQTGPKPVAIQLQAIHLGVANFDTAGGAAASYDLSAILGSAGRLSADGKFDVSSLQATGKLVLAQVDLPALQGFMRPALAAEIASGKLSAQANVKAALAPGHVNIHAEPAQITLDGVEVRAPEQTQNPIGWRHFGVNIARLDLASHQAIVREMRTDGLHLSAQRDPHGNLNFASLIRTQPPNRAAAPESRPAASEWQYRVESIALENTSAAIEDDSQRRPLVIQIAPVNLHVNGVTNDLAKPFTIEADGSIGRRGTFKLAGDAAIKPFKTRLRISSKRIALEGLDPLISTALAGSKLNVKVANAELTMNGAAEAQLHQGRLDASYRGGVRLGNVRVLDRLTGKSLLRWYALTLDGVAMRYGPAKPRIRVNGVALSNFYARVVLNSDGRLNLRDIAPSSGQPARPLTPPAGAPSPASARSAGPADIAIGGLRLQAGQVSYVDNFIRPNYSAELTELDGSVGAFGTSTTRPAAVMIAGKVNGDSPISISGSINPLAPMASVDIKADADRIELPPLTPYTTKYTGYPITGGTLTGDVHYVLANRQLTASNHIILDQLTFGDRLENSAARNLPVRLAVAILKDSQGRIDLRIPVSGSLADPTFSFGRVIWQALLNVILKAATSPFTVLASAIGGTNQELSYIEFSPGYSTLTQAGRSKLAKLAVALKQHPGLKLEISGRVDPKVDRKGLQEAMLEGAIKKQKAQAEAGPVDQVQVTPDEYNKYLWRVYKAADFAKPRDVVGMVKRLPPDDLKKLLLAHIKVSDADLRHLADARVATVHQALSGSIDAARLLTVAPKLSAEGITGQGPTTRVDFSLK
jgi:hypothetical protein